MVGVNCGVVGADYELVETGEWRKEMFTKKETPQDPHATGDLCGVHSHMQSYPANPMKSTHVLLGIQLRRPHERIHPTLQSRT